MPSPAILRLDQGISTPSTLATSRTVSSSAVEPLAAAHKLSGIEASKQLAAWTAVDRHVGPEHKVIGIGSGSTVPYVVERIIAQGTEINKGRVFIPTGFQSKELIVKGNLVLGDVDQYPSIDVTIDGADEVDGELNCIKGGGGCHLREKVLAEAAETFIVVADYRKKSNLLGTNWKQGVPIEVAPFAYAKLLQNLHRLGSPAAKLRMAVAKAGPVVSDNGNFIIDAPFGEEYMKHPLELLTRIKMLTGVVEVGLFIHMARAAYFGEPDGSVTVRLADGKTQTLQNTPLPTPAVGSGNDPSKQLGEAGAGEKPGVEEEPPTIAQENLAANTHLKN